MPKTLTTRPARTAATIAVLLIVAFSSSPSSLTAQRPVETRTPVDGFVIGGRVNLQFNTTSVEDEVDSQWTIRRARVYVGAQINEWLDGVAQLDWSGERAEGRLLFLRGTFGPQLRVSVGQFKRAFDLFELTSSSMILMVERAGSVRGVDTCAGIGRLCSYSRFTEALQHSSLDIGMMADGVFMDGRGTYRLTLTNGAGRNQGDENDAKSVASRLTWALTPDLVLGGNLGFHDYPNPVTGRDTHAPAWAVDLEWGSFEGGPHVQAGILFGENWKNLDGVGDGSDFMAVQGVATYRLPVEGNRYVEGLEPVVRASYGDPDRATGADQGWLFTPGLVAHLDGRNKMAANIDLWSPTQGERAWALLLQTYFYF